MATRAARRLTQACRGVLDIEVIQQDNDAGPAHRRRTYIVAVGPVSKFNLKETFLTFDFDHVIRRE
jgi:hypothetical protein